MKKKIVLAFSGGLDTSIILKWLQNEYDAEVVTFTADIGQGVEIKDAKKKLSSWVLSKFSLKIYKMNLSENMFFLCLGQIHYMKVIIY